MGLLHPGAPWLHGATKELPLFLPDGNQRHGVPNSDSRPGFGDFGVLPSIFPIVVYLALALDDLDGM